MAANGNTANMANIITALGNAFKDPSGATMSNDRLAAVLLQNMNQLTDLAKQGKLNQQQIMQVCHTVCNSRPLSTDNFVSLCSQLRDYADKHKPATTKQVRVILRPIRWVLRGPTTDLVARPYCVADGQRSPPGDVLGPQGNDGNLARPNARRKLQLEGYVPDQPGAEPNESGPRLMGGCNRRAPNAHGWSDGGPHSR